MASCRNNKFQHCCCWQISCLSFPRNFSGFLSIPSHLIVRQLLHLDDVVQVEVHQRGDQVAKEEVQESYLEYNLWRRQRWWENDDRKLTHHKIPLCLPMVWSSQEAQLSGNVNANYVIVVWILMMLTQQSLKKVYEWWWHAWILCNGKNELCHMTSPLKATGAIASDKESFHVCFCNVVKIMISMMMIIIESSRFHASCASTFSILCMFSSRGLLTES